MEEYLLECVLRLQRAGEDEGRRKREMQKPKAWSLLSIEWKAMAMLAATKSAPDAIDANAASGRSARGHRQRIGRRGGRVAMASLEERLANPRDVLTSDASSAYRLAVLIAQKHRMGDSWSGLWDDDMAALRTECEAGVHPVWERMAREAPLIAELGRFPTVMTQMSSVDSASWIEAARFDPLDHNALLAWLDSCPLRFDQHQAHALQRIVRDLLGGKARPSRWEKWMNPSLLGMNGDAALLEAMLFAAASNQRAADVFESFESPGLRDVSSSHLLLLEVRGGEANRWSEAADREGEDPLSIAIRLEAWASFSDDAADRGIESLISGHRILSDASRSSPTALRWRIVNGLADAGRVEESAEFIQGLEITNAEQMMGALAILRASGQAGLEDTIISTLSNSEDGLVLSVMLDEASPLNIRKKSAEILSLRGSQAIEEILEVFTLAADIDGLSREILADPKLAARFPQRALLVWHLIPASRAVSVLDSLEAARRLAILSLSGSQTDSALSNSASALIALLSGIPSEMDSVHEKLDSDGVLALNEVRRALSTRGDGVVRENRIEALEQSVLNAELTYLERNLFMALLDSLRLNRATMDLQSGVDERMVSALAALNLLCAKQEVAMRTIQGSSELVLEHNAAIVSLEEWYRSHDSGSAAHQIVRATIAREKGDRINAARAYRDAAMKAREDFERSALLLRKSLIEFAHAGGWKEAINLIDNHPELTASVTSRFQLYLRTCADTVVGKNAIATQRIIEYIAAREPDDPDIEGIDRAAVKRRLEALDRALSYAADHRLPEDPFNGRVRAAQRRLRRSDSSRRSNLEGRFLLELNEKKDVLEITLIAEEVAEISPIRALRMFETAIESGNFDLRQMQILVRSQKAMFQRHSRTIAVSHRRSLNHLALQPLVLIDTNILIDALKDDLLQQIAQDSIGSFDWTVERAFVWMLRRRNQEGRVLLCIPPAAQSEFLNRAKNPDSALALFNDIYIDRAVWKKKITRELLQERVQAICNSFGGFHLKADKPAKSEIDLDSFLVRHKHIFERITEQKMLSRDDPPPRTIIDGDDIYPEPGDCDIMQESAVHANSMIPDVGCVLVATRDTDFMLIARALQDSFGFGVIWTASQLNHHVL